MWLIQGHKSVGACNEDSGQSDDGRVRKIVKIDSMDLRQGGQMLFS